MRGEIVAYDREERPIALVGVRASFLDARRVDLLWEALRSRDDGHDWRYLLLVDFGAIRVARAAKAADPAEVVVLPTAEVLGVYEANLAAMMRDRTIYQDYFRALVEAWLRDLAYRWHGEDPQGSAPLTAIGLVADLEEGTTRSEVELDPDPVH